MLQKDCSSNYREIYWEGKSVGKCGLKVIMMVPAKSLNANDESENEEREGKGSKYRTRIHVTGAVRVILSFFFKRVNQLFREITEQRGDKEKFS